MNRESTLQPEIEVEQARSPEVQRRNARRISGSVERSTGAHSRFGGKRKSRGIEVGLRRVGGRGARAREFSVRSIDASRLTGNDAGHALIEDGRSSATRARNGDREAGVVTHNTGETPITG